MATGIFTLRNQLQGLIQKAWTGTQKTNFVEYLVVAGGGSSGGSLGAGGGAGGLLQGLVSVPIGSSITVTIGGGGAQPTASTIGNNGQNSVFGNITALGGGGGATWANGSGALGGSGGGGATSNGGAVPVGGQGTFGQGNSGGTVTGTYSSYTSGGGGGGAGTVGLGGALSTVGFNGGAGIASSIAGTTYVFAGGGGGFEYNSGAGGAGGVGGGGGGGSSLSTGGAGGTGYNNGTAGSTSGWNGGNGGANTGGGGGGCSVGNSGTGGIGGSGIVIISYPDTYNAPTALTGTYTASTSGSGSLSFTLNTNYLNYAGQSTFAFGSNSFTIEMWIYPTTSSSGTRQIIYDSKPNGGSGLYPTISLSSGTNISYYTNGNDQILGGAVTFNAWSHVALVKNGSTTTLYLNGVSQGTYADTNTYLNGASRPSIATNGGALGAAGFGGYISNLRVVNGTAVYTTTFTPPTAPLAPITNTVLLLGTISGSYLNDNSTNAYNATVTGSPTWNQASPFATGLGYKNRVYTWTASGTVTF